MFRKTMAVMAVLVGISMLGAAARAEGTSVELSVTHAERYIWRGVPLNEEYVLQPSLTVGAAGFYVNGWANVDMTAWGDHRAVGYGDEAGRPTEIDYSAGYEGSLFDDKLILGFGFANYTFPHQDELPLVATTEIYGTVGFGIPLSPTFTAYVDEDQNEGAAYIALDLGHSFPLWESGDASVALEANGHLGWANHKFISSYYFQDSGKPLNKDSRFHDWMLQAALPITLAPGVSITPTYTYTSIMTDELRDRIDASAADLDKEVGIFTVTLALSTDI